jgi:selenocysteine lyase/cysteine desulfurase
LRKAVDPIALQGGHASYSSSLGVTSIPSVIGLGATFSYLSTIGLELIASHNAALRNRLFPGLHDVPKMVPKNWMNGIRDSTHLFNTNQDVDVLLAALKRELALASRLRRAELLIQGRCGQFCGARFFADSLITA